MFTSTNLFIWEMNNLGLKDDVICTRIVMTQIPVFSCGFHCAMQLTGQCTQNFEKVTQRRNLCVSHAKEVGRGASKGWAWWGGSSQVKRVRVQGGRKIVLRQKEKRKFREKLKTREKYEHGKMHTGLWLFPGTDISTIESEEWDCNLELNLNSESTKSYISSETQEAIVNQLLIH